MTGYSVFLLYFQYFRYSAICVLYGTNWGVWGFFEVGMKGLNEPPGFVIYYAVAGPASLRLSGFVR